MGKLRDIKYAIDEPEDAKDKIVKGLSERRGRLLLFKAVVPVGVIFSFLWALSSLDHFLFENPELKKQLEAEAIAYEQSLQDMLKGNPWGTASTADPKIFILTLFKGMNQELKAKLGKILEGLSPEKLRYLVTFLTMVELSDEQLQRFILSIEKILLSNKAAEKINLIGALVPKLIPSLLNAKKVDPSNNNVQNQQLNTLLGEANSLEVQQELINTEDKAEFLLQLLTLKDPESLDYLLDVIVEYDTSTYNKIMSILGDLSNENADFFLELIDGLNEREIKALLDFSTKIEGKSINKLMTEFKNLTNSQIMDIVNNVGDLDSKTLNLFAERALNFTDFKKNVPVFSEFLSWLSGKYRRLLLEVIAPKVDNELFESIILTLSGPIRVEAGKAIEIMAQSKFTGDIIAKADRLLGSTLKVYNAQEAVKILVELGDSSIQRDMVEEADYLNRDNANKSIETFKEIKTGSKKKSIKVSQSINSKSKNTMASEFFRLKEYRQKDPSAVAGVRGKPDVTRKSKAINTGVDLKYTEYKRVERVEKVIDKVHALNQTDVTQDMLAVSVDVSDKSLKKASDIFIDLDISSDKNRARRLVSTYKRIDKNRRESAIETLDDMTVEHVSAAVDIGHRADKKLLQDSVDYTTKLRDELGHVEGTRANMRLVNVASKVKTNKDRRDGLAQLKKERESRVKKILIQTDGHPEIFNGQRIVAMTQLYKKLDEQYPKRTVRHRTPAVKLADTLSGSHGLVLGAAPNSTGLSREITQETKLFRINQYLSDDPVNQSKLEGRANFLTSRTMEVYHEGAVFNGNVIKEDNFDIQYPDLIK